MRKPYSIFILIFTLLLGACNTKKQNSIDNDLPTSEAFQNETDEFVSKLKTHYKKTLPIKAFSLNHHYLNKRYRDLEYWDYQKPNRMMSVRLVELDLIKKHFYDNDLHYSSGGWLRDYVQFQNDKESYYFERNGSSFGKRIIKQSMSRFDRAMSYFVMNVDFVAVRPLLEETNIEGNISLHQDRESGTTTLKHKTSDDNVNDYKFSNNPLQLMSVNHRSLGGTFVYNDYQTTRGITYARSVHQYYDGATEPNYIIFNDQFNIIKEVDPTKLQIPEGYGPEMPKRDGVLGSKEIAKDLYLVTDASARHNSLFKVSGDKIMVFGASGNTRLAEKTIKLILDQFPKKKINSVYVSHPHGHQIAGLQAYAKRGIVIHADAYSVAAIKAYPGFVEDITKFKFQTIEHQQVIDGAHFYILENMHSKRQSFVYFKDSGVIFQAHFLHIAVDNTIAKVIPNYTRTFIDFVRSKKLKFSRIVANYNNNNISAEVMNKTYDAIM